MKEFIGRTKKILNPTPLPAIASLKEMRVTCSHVYAQFIKNIEQSSFNSAKESYDTDHQIDEAIEQVASVYDLVLTISDIQYIRKTVIEDVKGLGPLASLMADPEISDILVNGPKDVWVDKNGKLQKTTTAFEDETHLRRVLDRLVSQAGKYLDAGSPSVDAKLSDGSRLHAIIPPLCASGAIISIRRFRQDVLDFKTLLEQEFLSDTMHALLITAVRSGMNIVIAGGAGAGKTTLLKILASHIPEDERVITIEETAELNIQHPHVISLETRSVNTEERGNISLRDLVRNALRMRANRIIVGEVRGEEVMDMLQAMNVGHDGSITTVHANSAFEVLTRLETLALLSSASLPRVAITNMIGSAIDLIVHIARFRDGKRRITSITELNLSNGQANLHELFRFTVQSSNNNQIAGAHTALAAPISEKLTSKEILS